MATKYTVNEIKAELGIKPFVPNKIDLPRDRKGKAIIKTLADAKIAYKNLKHAKDYFYGIYGKTTDRAWKKYGIKPLMSLFQAGAEISSKAQDVYTDSLYDYFTKNGWKDNKSHDMAFALKHIGYDKKKRNDEEREYGIDSKEAIANFFKKKEMQQKATKSKTKEIKLKQPKMTNKKLTKMSRCR